jgi:chemotaxis regulatin CheY-phosphate phosphatase CheZ
MIEFLARFSPRLQNALRLSLDIDEVFRAVEELLRDRSADPHVQAVRNDIADVRRRLHAIREV